MTEEIPKVTVEDVSKACEKLQDRQEQLKVLLRWWFSSPENIDVFSKFVFPEYIKGKTPNFHREFYSYLLDPLSYAWAAPRGHAKSTTCGLVFIAWCYCNRKEDYIVYISQNHEKTVQFIEPHRIEPKENPRMRWLYGDLTSKAVIGENGKDREDCIDINGVRIQALSFEKNIRGIKFKSKRPTLIIGDDIEDDQRVKNPQLRHNDYEKLTKAVIPSLDIEKGRFKMIGTILHLDSLLMKQIRKCNGKIYKAEENGEILWDGYFTRERLNNKKKEIGTVAYQQEYLNNPIDNSTSIIKSEWVRACFDYDYNETYETLNQTYLGVDFAFSDRVTADSSSFMDVGIDSQGKKCTHKMRWRKGMSINEQMTLTNSLYESIKYNIIAFEENSIKGSVKDIRSLNLPIKMFHTGSRDAQNLDKMGKKTDSTTYSKINAINRLAVEFENSMWRIPYKTEEQQKNANKLLSELTSWALEDGKLVELGEHPDAPISMILVNEVLSKPKVICV